MATERRRRTVGAAALSAAAHLVVLGVAALQAPSLRTRPEAGTPPPTVVPVILMPRHVRPAARAAAVNARRPSLRQAPDTLPVAPLPVAPSPAPPAAATSPSTGPDLAAVLRRGAVGCANAAAVGLSRAEREKCEERLAAGARTAPHLWGMETAKREYYAAVAEAKAPDPAPTQGQAIGRLGIFETDMRGMKGHGPGFGCKVHFGPGKKPPNAPPHALRLGPCFLEPPAGSLSPDVDVPLP